MKKIQIIVVFLVFGSNSFINCMRPLNPTLSDNLSKLTSTLQNLAKKLNPEFISRPVPQPEIKPRVESIPFEDELIKLTTMRIDAQHALTTDNVEEFLKYLNESYRALETIIEKNIRKSNQYTGPIYGFADYIAQNNDMQKASRGVLENLDRLLRSGKLTRNQANEIDEIIKRFKTKVSEKPAELLQLNKLYSAFEKLKELSADIAYNALPTERTLNNDLEKANEIRKIVDEVIQQLGNTRVEAYLTHIGFYKLLEQTANEIFALARHIHQTEKDKDKSLKLQKIILEIVKVAFPEYAEELKEQIQTRPIPEPSLYPKIEPYPTQISKKLDEEAMQQLTTINIHLVRIINVLLENGTGNAIAQATNELRSILVKNNITSFYEFSKLPEHLTPSIIAGKLINIMDRLPTKRQQSIQSELLALRQLLTANLSLTDRDKVNINEMFKFFNIVVRNEVEKVGKAIKDLSDKEMRVENFLNSIDGILNKNLINLNGSHGPLGFAHVMHNLEIQNILQDIIKNIEDFQIRYAPNDYKLKNKREELVYKLSELRPIS